MNPLVLEERTAWPAVSLRLELGSTLGWAGCRVDESHLTGESDDVGKDPGSSQALYAGSKVVTGFGRMLVTAVGPNSQVRARSGGKGLQSCLLFVHGTPSLLAR